MKIIKVKIDGNESIYVMKRRGIFSRKHEIYWISQNMALPVVDISSQIDNKQEKESK